MRRASTDRRRRAASGGAAPPLSRTAVRALRHFLNAYREGWLLEDRLATAARLVAEDAHRRHLPPERMLVALTRTWETLAEARRLPPVESGALRSELVSLGIRAYFEVERGPQPGADADGHDDARTAA